MKRFFLANSILLVALLAVVLSGFLERFADDGSVPVAVYATSLICYWAVVNLSFWVLIRQRSHWPKIALACVSVLLSLSLLEVSARVLFPIRTAAKWRHVKSDVFHHIGPANRQMYEGRYAGVDVLIKTNEDGLRTKYSRSDFLQHKNRIAVMGDSYVFGLGVPQDQIVTEQLEEILRERTGEDVAVLNAAFISYSPFVQNILYREIVRHYQPQTVLLVLDINDIGDDIRYEADARVSDDGKVSFPGRSYHPPRFHSALWNLLDAPRQEFAEEVALAPWKILARLLGVAGVVERPEEDYYQLNLTIGETQETNRFFILRHSLDQTQPYFDATLANIQRLADQVHADEARFLLAPAPRYFHWSEEECPNNWEAFRYKNDEPFRYEFFRYFDERRDELDFPVLDMLSKYRDTEEFPLVFASDAHWNAKGHEFAARALADLIHEE